MDLQAIYAIQQEPGKAIWLYGGSKLITSFLNAGLIDEMLLAVFPVILGAGKPLFTAIGNRIELELIETTPSASGTVLLHYKTVQK
jgi:dihydrofolate reductase